MSAEDPRSRRSAGGTSRADGPTFFDGGVRLAPVFVLVLAACASSPMPPWPTTPVGVVQASLSPASPSAPPSAGAVASMPSAAPPPVATRPIPPPPARSAALVAGAGGPPLPVAPPMSAGVAARFPEPALTFATPAFTAGRQSFTDSDELRDILYGLERAAAGVAARRTEVRVVDLGSSQSGLPLEALAFTRAATDVAAPTAAAPSAPARRPAVLLIAGQHGDEPAGTEALLVVAQDLAAGRLDAVLDRVDVVLLPRANPDGAALFQRGAADGSDINRDHLLLNTPEAQAQARLLIEFAPIVVLDLHEYAVSGAFTEKFGAVQRHDALLQYATVANMPTFVTRAAEEWFRVPLLASLRSAGLSADWYATTSSDLTDKRLTMGGSGPQIARNAAGLRNSVSLLVETRGGGLGRTHLKRRVQTQVVAVTSVLASAARHAGDLARLRQFVERDTAARACRGEAVLDTGPTPSEYALSVLDRESGAIRQIDVAWNSALALRTLKSRPRPCGYWLAASEVDAARRLRLLGIEVMQLESGVELRGETFRETARQPVSGESAATRLVVQTVPALLEIAAGGFYVSLEQPLANLAIAALEPEVPASFAANRVIGSVGGVARILQRPEARMTSVP